MLVFFCKQKTAYEMRISDWSSDVCSSDLMGFRGVGSDITEARLSEDKINRMARYDALTGLPNRALLMDGLEESLARTPRLKRSCALMFIALDRFQSINATLGHQLADKRSEERRVGKECVRTFRSRWSTDH